MFPNKNTKTTKENQDFGPQALNKLRTTSINKHKKNIKIRWTINISKPKPPKTLGKQCFPTENIEQLKEKHNFRSNTSQTHKGNTDYLPKAMKDLSRTNIS